MWRFFYGNPGSAKWILAFMTIGLMKSYKDKYNRCITYRGLLIRKEYAALIGFPVRTNESTGDKRENKYKWGGYSKRICGST